MNLKLKQFRKTQVGTENILLALLRTETGILKYLFWMRCSVWFDKGDSEKEVKKNQIKRNGWKQSSQSQVFHYSQTFLLERLY